LTVTVYIIIAIKNCHAIIIDAILAQIIIDRYESTQNVHGLSAEFVVFISVSGKNIFCFCVCDQPIASAHKSVCNW